MGFKGFDKVSPSSGGNKFKVGNYLVMVNRFFSKESRKEVDMCILECKILVSDNQQMRPGSSADCLYMSDQEASVADLKRVLMVALDEEDPGEITEESIEKIEKEETLIGLILKVEAYEYVTKKNNKTIVLCRWAQASAAEQEKAAKAGVELEIMSAEIASAYLPKKSNTKSATL
jgi:hypothetical protein